MTQSRFLNLNLVRSSKQRHRFFCSMSYILWVAVWARLSGLQPGLKAESVRPVRMMSVSNWDGALLAEPRDWQLITDTLNSSAHKKKHLLLRRPVSRSPPHRVICGPPLSVRDLCHLRDSSVWRPSIRVWRPLRWCFGYRPVRSRHVPETESRLNGLLCTRYTPTILKT